MRCCVTCPLRLDLFVGQGIQHPIHGGPMGRHLTALKIGLGEFQLPKWVLGEFLQNIRVARAGHELQRIMRPVVAIRVHARNMSGDSTEALRRANLDRFSTKHALPPIPLKNHLDIATHAPGTPPTSP